MGDNDNITVEDIDSAPESLAPDDIPEKNFSVLLQRFTLVSEEFGQLQIEHNRLKDATQAAQILNELIKPFATRTFNFMCTYCGFVGAVLLINASGLFAHPVSDAVLQILVGSTAVTVIGLVGMVLTGIFVGARKKHEQ